MMLVLALPAAAQDQATVLRVTQAACGPDDVQFNVKTDGTDHPMGTPETGKALVYVIEDQRYKALSDVTVRVGVDGSWMGADRGNSYLFFSTGPGEHHLCADWNIGVYPGPMNSDRQISLANFTVEPGKVYYFRARTIGGRDIEPIFDLELVNNDEGQLLLGSSAFSRSQASKQVRRLNTPTDPNNDH